MAIPNRNDPTSSQTGASSEGADEPPLKRWLGALFKSRNGNADLRESLEGVLEEHRGSDGEMAPEEHVMLANLLGFGKLRVEDVMVPLADIVAVDENATLEDVVAVFRKGGHSRVPVYRGTLDDPLGMYHIKDIIPLLAEKSEGKKLQPFALSKVRRPILFVPPSMAVIDLLQKMQATRNHMALVIDEYGGTDGLVTIEDLVEEIVGDIEDEHDRPDAALLVPLEDGTFEASARVPIEEVEAATGLALAPPDEEEGYDTLGGLVVYMIDRVPERGEVIYHPEGLEIEVVDADPRRIKKLRLRPASNPIQGGPSTDLPAK